MTGWAVNSNMSLKGQLCVLCAHDCDRNASKTRVNVNYLSNKGPKGRQSPFVYFRKGLAFIFSIFKEQGD